MAYFCIGPEPNLQIVSSSFLTDDYDRSINEALKATKDFSAQ